MDDTSSARSAVRGLANGERAALLLSEFQNSMTNAALSGAAIAKEASRRGIAAKAAHLAQACREAAVPVIFGTLVPRDDYAGFPANCYLSHNIRKERRLQEGSPLADLHPDIAPEPGDWRSVRRQGISDWSGSELDQILRNLRVETLILAGVSTNVGVFATCVGAVDRGYSVIVVEDCTAGTPQEHHDIMMARSFPLLSTVACSENVISTLVARANQMR